jgi:hypothetical protein
MTPQNLKFALFVCASHPGAEKEGPYAFHMVSIFIVIDLIQTQPNFLPELDDATLKLAAS